MADNKGAWLTLELRDIPTLLLASSCGIQKIPLLHMLTRRIVLEEQADQTMVFVDCRRLPSWCSKGLGDYCDENNIEGEQQKRKSHEAFSKFRHFRALVAITGQRMT